ncbi:MAG: hypothetical protein WAT71_09935 [Ignavibacteria bacterium]
MKTKKYSKNNTTKGEIMKSMISIICVCILILSFTSQDTYSQNKSKSNVNKTKSSSFHKKGGKKIDMQLINGNIEKNKRSFVKDSRGSWLLEENFESGIFPPIDWTVTSGDQQWDQSYYSAFGNGDYSMFYSSWNCEYSDNTVYSPEFGPTDPGNYLIFDYAYAPWDDGSFTYYDEYEIFYSDDYGSSWYSLVYYTGDSIQTAPPTNNYYQPQNNEWGTKVIELPNGTTNFYIQAYENCSNNFYVDNFRIGVPSNSSDAAVRQIWAKGRIARPFYSNDTIAVVIENTSFNSMINLPVYLNITGANTMQDTVVISNLQGNSSTVVKFKPFNPSVNGNSVIHVTLPHTDDDPYNDSATYLCNVNSTTFSFVDTTGNYYSGAGYFDAVYMLSKFRVTSATAQVSEVKYRVPDFGFGIRMAGQTVRGVVLDSIGKIVAKSIPYKLKDSDQGATLTFNITDPGPYKIPSANTQYVAGIEYSDPIGTEVFWNARNQEEDPLRPDGIILAFSQIVGVGSNLYLYAGGERYDHQSSLRQNSNIDAVSSSLGLLYNQYYNTTTITPTGKVYNAGTGSATFTVNRKITPGGYTSTKTVTGLGSNSSSNVNFDPWTFTSGTAYTVRDSVILTGDGNTSNNVLSGTLTPRIAKDMVVLWQKDEDRDSLVRSILADGRYANNFDTIDINYDGTYRSWKIMFVCTKSSRTFLNRVRDSLKSFIDASTVGNKKSLIAFSDKTAQVADPNSYDYSGVPADSIFFRQYLKSEFVDFDWLNNVPQSSRKFKGKGFFDGVTQDSVGDPQYSTTTLLKPTNGGSAAFVPSSVTGTGSDSAAAVSYAGANYNTFFMSNRFSDLRASSNSSRGPVLVYTKIIDWLQSISSNVKVLDITALYEGLYNQNTNLMIGDTVKVFLRNSASPYAKVDSAKGFLNSSGIGSLLFSNASNGVNYYIHMKHRNGLETWSNTTVMFTANHVAYNFTTNANKAFGNNMILKGSKWTFYSGDVNQDGVIDIGDNTMIENDAFNFASGYIATDINGDGITDLDDQSFADNNANNFVSKVTPGGVSPEPENNRIVNTNEAVQNSELKIDHEIYERTKDQMPLNNNENVQRIVVNKNGYRIER